jgi:tetratricopeptide (TPR) repeat protein
VATSLHNLAAVLTERGDHARAEALFREAIALRHKLLGNEHPHLAMSLGSLAEMFCRDRKPAEAEPLAREALAIFKKAHPGGHWNISQAESLLGECLTLSQRYPEAETLLLRSYSALEAQRGERSPQSREFLQRIVRLYEAWGKADKAAQYRAELAAKGPDAGR